MGLLALFLSLFGALAAIVAILTATQTVPPLGDEFTTIFWLNVSSVLFLACIASLLSGGKQAS
jgi:hypothetical protein